MDYKDKRDRNVSSVGKQLLGSQNQSKYMKTARNINYEKIQARCQGRDWMMMIFSLMQKR